MCGFAGVVGSLEGVDRAAMLDALVHRGPDDDGECVLPTPAGQVWLGHRRLSIVDLSPRGHQPMTSSDGRLTLVFNGMIYNYRELQRDLETRGYHFVGRSDTEVVLAAWAEWGEEALGRLRGMFAFALWDATQHRLWLARDRMGEKPLYFIRQANRLLFAS